MASFIIEGGHKLHGEITPQGAKNEVLQEICATLLTSEKVTIENIPDIADVNNLINQLINMGVSVTRNGVGCFTFQADNINLDYNNYIIETDRNINANMSFNNTLNSISSRTQYNEETGGRITRPENINGNWSVSGNFGFRTPIFIDKLTISTNTSTSFNNNVSYLYQNQETMKNKVKNLRIGERLTLTWREEYFDVVLNGSLNYNNSRSKLLKSYLG